MQVTLRDLTNNLKMYYNKIVILDTVSSGYKSW